MRSVLGALLETTVYSSAILCCILAFRRLFQKALSARLQFLLWSVFVLQLLLPVRIESGFHIEGLFPELPRPPVVAVQAQSPAAASPSRPDGASSSDPQSPAQGVSAEAAPKHGAPVWTTVLFGAWLTGAVAALGFTGASQTAFARRVRRATVENAPGAEAMLVRAKKLLDVRAPVRLVTAALPVSPAMMLLRGRSTLLLPDSLTDARTLGYVALHELVHFRRRDHLLLLLLALLRAVYWFNPLVHLGFSELRADMETACDARVLAVLDPAEKRRYLTALLRLFTENPQPAPGMAQATTRRLVERRMKGAFMKRKSTRAAWAAAVMLGLLLLVFCFTTACQAAPEAVPGATNSLSAALPESPGAGAASYAITGSGDTVTADNGARRLTFAIVDLGYASGSVVPPDALDAAAVAADAIARLTNAFGEQVESCAAYVTGYCYPEDGSDWFEVRFGAETFEAAQFIAYCSGAGQTTMLENLQHDRGLPESDDLDWSTVDVDAVGADALAAAKTFAQERLANGRAILEDSFFDGVQATFRGDDPICVDTYIHFDAGESYSLRVWHPSLTVTQVRVFPALPEGAQYEWWEIPEPEKPGVADLSAADYREVLAYCAENRVGQALAQSAGSAAERSAASRGYIHQLLEHAFGPQEFRWQLSEPMEPRLTRGDVFRLGGADGEYRYGVYLGDGRYAYADFDALTAATARITDGWGERFTEFRLIETAPQA